MVLSLCIYIHVSICVAVRSAWGEDDVSHDPGEANSPHHELYNYNPNSPSHSQHQYNDEKSPVVPVYTQNQSQSNMIAPMNPNPHSIGGSMAIMSGSLEISGPSAVLGTADSLIGGGFNSYNQDYGASLAPPPLSGASLLGQQGYASDHITNPALQRYTATEEHTAEASIQAPGGQEQHTAPAYEDEWAAEDDTTDNL